MNALIYSPHHNGFAHFANPRELIAPTTVDGVLPALDYIDHQVNCHNRFAAGFVCYEAAPAFDAALQVHPPQSNVPLLCFGIFDSFTLVNPPPPPPPQPPLQWLPEVDKNTFDTKIAAIKDAIAAGATYQVNYTYRLCAPFNGDVSALFWQLYHAQPTPYAALIQTPAHSLCSLSPELFFELDHSRITTRPMKGTIRRGLTTAQDSLQARALEQSEKNRAENVMIVDMIRNDLGRVADTASVKVESLFNLEKLPGVWQMTSSVSACTSASLTNIFRALFPCASITGAPKVKTMQLIHQLESSPRGLYTGAIGTIFPNRQVRFSVAIRTLWLDHASATARYGTGGGIVWDSTTDEEYGETLLKAQLICSPAPRFHLLETLLWEPVTGFFLLDKHLARLQDSAHYFDFTCDRASIRQQLQTYCRPFGSSPMRVRLTLDQSGLCSLEATELPPQSPAPLTLGLCSQRVDANVRFLYHKTTHRTLYEEARAHTPAGCDDSILINSDNQLTETTIGNLLYRLDGALYTPPVHCGLLAGCYRAQLLEQGTIRERVLALEEIDKVEEWLRTNSVRGMQRAVLVRGD